MINRDFELTQKNPFLKAEILFEVALSLSQPLQLLPAARIIRYNTGLIFTQPFTTSKFKESRTGATGDNMKVTESD